MKIVIISDVHDAWETLEQAVAIAEEKQCAKILCAGDLISPPGLRILAEFSGEVEIVLGNNEGALVVYTRLADSLDNINFHDDTYEGEIAGKKIFMHHIPRVAEFAAKTGDFDICIHGHDHTFREEKIGSTVLLNPGEVRGTKNPASMAIVDLGQLSVEKIDL